jgi:long-chain acyl-CoA synthetase
METYRLFDFLDANVYKSPASYALGQKIKGDWVYTTFQEYQFQASRMSVGLMQLGVKKGDLIGSVSTNRAEWNFLDMGILQIGAVHVSLHPAYSVQDILYILEQTRLRYFFCGNRILYKLLLPHLSKLPDLKAVFCFDEGEHIRCWSEILPDAISEVDIAELQLQKSKVKPTDVATILYTSGTGGNPKGAIHTHATFGVFASNLTDNYSLEFGENALSILSISHAFERLHYYFYLKQGAVVFYSTNNCPLTEQIFEIKPHMVVCVPMLIEGFYKAITEEQVREQDNLAADAILYAQQFSFEERATFYQSDSYKRFEDLYTEWRERMGGNFRQIITGAAMIPEYLVKFFWTIKLPLFECYGSTEALLHTINHERFGYKINTVGKTLPYAEVCVSEDNEIWIKSESVMSGYYKLSKLTQTVLDDNGWYHTGDAGYIDADGFLHITGRTNTIFKLLNGKYLNPELLEQQLSVSHLIKHIFITQDENHLLAAVIVPAEDDKIIRKEILDFIDTSYNRKWTGAERIQKILWVNDTWKVETGEFTPTMKLKRKNLKEKYLPLFNQAVQL